MRIAVTGFVSEQAGSVASANALLLRALLERNCEIHFFSKASFVDPRPAVGRHTGFQFTDVDNRLADRTRALLAPVPVANRLASLLDAASYNRLLVQEINEANARNQFDLCLWLGDYASGTIAGIPTVSFVQGPPGTDARSLIRRSREISQLAGTGAAWKWKLLARIRLSRLGSPRLQNTDRFIVGSKQSQSTLRQEYHIAKERICRLPYPIDLQLFNLPVSTPASPSLRCLWLGRIIPRKRLDLFLNGAAEAIRRGCDLRLSVIGAVGFVPGYEKLIQAFPHPDRLHWTPSLARDKIPEAMHSHDLLVQPSEEENFGSSVAEAQACGLPVIVGATNGNADYLCPRDIRLQDYRVGTLADAFSEMAMRQRENRSPDPKASRQCALQNFSLSLVADRLRDILDSTRHSRLH